MDQQSLDTIIKGIIAGDAPSEKKIFNYYTEEIEFFVKRKIGKTNSDVEDLCQDIFIAIFQRIRDNQYDSRKGTFGAFLYSTFKYKILDYLKSPRFRRRHDYEDVAEMEIVNGKQNPERELEEKNKRQLLKQAILDLEEPYKEIIYLLIYKQLRVKEISIKLGISEQKVSNLKSYAITLLQNKVKKF